MNAHVLLYLSKELREKEKRLGCAEHLILFPATNLTRGPLVL